MAEMTAQKALEILEMFLHKQCDLQRTEFAYSQNEVWKAVKIANDVLEAQIQGTTEQEKTLTLVFGKDGKARVLNEDYVIYCADEETFEKVKKAVEKQEPKKPTYEADGYGEDGNLIYDRAICPNCDNDDFEYDINNWGCKYCPDCGQALDWSDTE